MSIGKLWIFRSHFYHFFFSRKLPQREYLNKKNRENIANSIFYSHHTTSHIVPDSVTDKSSVINRILSFIFCQEWKKKVFSLSHSTRSTKAINFFHPFSTNKICRSFFRWVHLEKWIIVHNMPTLSTEMEKFFCFLFFLFEHSIPFQRVKKKLSFIYGECTIKWGEEGEEKKFRDGDDVEHTREFHFSIK